EQFEFAGIGAVAGRGPLIAALQGERRDLSKLGLSGTMRRGGFQAHDGRIFDALTTRGGILVAIESEPRAADALALLHSYGGGNAAIGAWTGRVLRTVRPCLWARRLTNTPEVQGTCFAVAAIETGARQYFYEPHNIADG